MTNPKGRIKQPKAERVASSQDDKTGNEDKHLANGWDREIKYLATKADLEKCRTEVQKLRADIAEVKVWWLGKVLATMAFIVMASIAIIKYFFG